MGGQISFISVLSGTSQSLAHPDEERLRQGIFVGLCEMFEAPNRAIAVNQLRPIINRVFSSAEVVQAFCHMESAAYFGKICIRIDAG